MTVEMAIVVPASSNVAGAYSARSSRTGRRLCCESPKSPWNRLPRYVKYCTGNGLSSPYRRLKAATASGSSIARWPRLAAAGSPGTTLVSRNVTNVMPSKSSTAASSRRVKNRPTTRVSPSFVRSLRSLSPLGRARSGRPTAARSASWSDRRSRIRPESKGGSRSAALRASPHSMRIRPDSTRVPATARRGGASDGTPPP